MKANVKKCTVFMIVFFFVVTLVPITADAKVNKKNPGGVSAFFVGCCFGLREGLEYNEGASLHWREIMPIIPYVGIIFAIWNGLECYDGTTAHEWAEQNGANWY